MTLVSVVLRPKIAYSSNTPLPGSGPPLLQGRLCTLTLLPASHEVLRLAKVAFFLSRKEFLPLPPQLGLSFIEGVPLMQFSVLSQG